MEEMRKESEMGTNESEHEDDYIQIVLFTAGTTLLMVVLKRAEQWRAWIFLVLNLVLVAILFRSIRSTPTTKQESNCNAEAKFESKKRRQCRLPAVQLQACGKCNKIYRSAENKQEHVEDGVHIPQLSKEELNERAEAFIASFRKHLVLDAKKVESRFFPITTEPKLGTLQT